MIRTVNLLLVLILFGNLHGETSVTFRLNMQPLIEKNLFSPTKGERLFVRGSFNAWKGEAFELTKNADTNIFRGTFNINANIGDTLEFKFIIKKPEGQIYWERRPNPANKNHGNRQVVITSSDVTIPIATFDYDEYIKFPINFTQKKLQEDFLQMRKVVEENHPALYDYTAKETLDSLFEHQYKLIDNDLDFNEFYRILSTVLERIGCGHTKLWIPSDYWNIVPKRLFPLKIHFIQDKVFVSGYYSPSSQISLGSEIISINTMPIQEIIKTLKAITSSDGFIQAFKSKTVEKNFSKRYALVYGYPEIFSIKYVAPGEFTPKATELLPVAVEVIDKNPVRGSELSLKLLEQSNAAILTINTFIYYDQLELFKSFIDSSFETIKKLKTANLIIDLRGNDGGDPFCSSYLLSFIEDKPVPYFAESYGKYAALAQPIPLAPNNFKGNLYTLIDGSGFSTTGHFCALLKYHQIGTLVGTETGATFTCTGSVHYVDLAHTKLILGTARNRRYRIAVENMDRTRGVVPDYQVESSQNDLINGKDTVLEFVLNLIFNNHWD